MRLRSHIALAVGIAAATLPGAALAHELFEHPAPPAGSVPAPSREFTSGPAAAKWEFVGTVTTGNPHSDLDFFDRGGETYASVGTLAAGANGGGQNIVQLTTKGAVTAPRLVASAPTASCQSTGTTGLQHDVEATPKGAAPLNSFNPFAAKQDAQLLLDASDATGRCHDQGLFGAANAPQGGLEIIDVTDPTKPQTIGLTSHIGQAHTVNVDPKRPHIAYAVTSDTVSVNAAGKRQNEVAGSADRLDLDGFEVMDLSSCMNFAPSTPIGDKRTRCRPEVFRYRYPSAAISNGHTQKNFVFGCHELEVYPNDRLTCGSGPALLVFDMTEVFDDRGTPDDFTDDKLRGTRLPCSVRNASSQPPFTTAARVTDCVTGGENRSLNLDVPGWIDLGSPSLAGVKHLGSVFHQGGHPSTATDPDGQQLTTADQDIKFNHEAELSSSGNLLIATDERGGGVTPPGASCAQGNPNSIGNGGVHFYRADKLLPAVPATKEAAYEAYARTPQGGKAIYRAPVRTGAQATVCTAHVMQQIPGQNRIFMGWYSQGTQVIDFTERPDGTVELKEAGFFIPANANTWVSHIFRAQANPDGTFTYFGATGDFNLGERGRNAVDVYKVTLPAAPLPADGPGVIGRRTVREPAGNQVAVSTRSGAPACTPSSAFGAASVRTLRGRLSFAFRATGPVTVDVFQQSSGRRVTGERLVKRFPNLRRAVRWNGRDRRGRQLRDGVYIVRFRATAPNGLPEFRRTAVVRRRGRFSLLPAYSGQDGCGLVRSFKLERPVFGGRGNRALNIAFRFGDEVRATVTVRRGTRVLKTFPDRAYRGGQLHRLRLTAKASRFPRGRYVVTLTATGPDGKVQRSTRTAARL